MTSPAGSDLKVLLVQGNVDPRAKWLEDPDSSFAIYEALTREAVKETHPDLVLWPETAIPAYLGHQQSSQHRVRRFAAEIGAAILTGAPHYELIPGGGYQRYNSAFFFPADGSAPQRYDKIRLVPFGERVPFQKWFPSLGELNFGQAEFTAGKNYAVFSLARGARVAPQICFESVFGDETRHFVLGGAQVLCNLTNDGWYGNSSGPYQHAALVRFRSIETRRPLVRAANTGISLAVDQAGRVLERIPYNVKGTRMVSIQAGSGYLTFYVRHGELIPRLMALLAAMGLLAAQIKQGSAKRA